MNVYGIIAEYNPFHNGHLYQLQKIKEYDPQAKIIVAMSGSFTQRGSLAVLDKWERAEFAVHAGADLVCELPTLFVLQSAQYFAEGGISLLCRSGILDYIVFGTEETFSLKQAQAGVEFMTTENFSETLKNNLSLGLPYAAAIGNALIENGMISEEAIKSPNNILAIEYLKALRKEKNTAKPLPIERICALHNDEKISGNIASASAIRRELFREMPREDLLRCAIPPFTFENITKLLQKKDFPSSEILFRSLLLKLHTLDLIELRKIHGIKEGLEYSVLKAAEKSATFEEFFDNLKSKRYSLTTLRRLSSALLLSLSKEDVESARKNGTLYIRPLAFNSNGREILRNIKKKSSLPIITNVADFLTSRNFHEGKLSPLQKMLSFDVRAQNIYSLSFSKLKATGKDYTHSPIVVQ